MDETAAWRQLEAAVDAALWRYAEAVTGQPRAAAEGGPGAPGLFGPRDLHLARLSAARRLHATPDATDRSAAARARAEGASYPVLALAAGMARQPAWRRYRPGGATGTKPPRAPARPAADPHAADQAAPA